MNEEEGWHMSETRWREKKRDEVGIKVKRGNVNEKGEEEERRHVLGEEEWKCVSCDGKREQECVRKNRDEREREGIKRRRESWQRREITEDVNKSE